MKSQDVVLFVFDEESHFKDKLDSLGKESFKKVIRVDSLDSLTDELNLLEKDIKIHLVVHIFYTDQIKGIQNFIASGIKKTFPLLDVRFISDGTLGIVKEDIGKQEFGDDTEKYLESRLQKYHQVRSSIDDEKVDVFTVGQHLGHSIENPKIDNVDYVVITALEEDEMTKVLPLINKVSKIENNAHLIEYGEFKSKPEKKVIYTSQASTGMVDAAIIASELITRYSPKFLIMTGVLGGKPKDTKIGDVIISKSVFTIDKGKITNEVFKKEIEQESTTSSYTTAIIRAKEKIINFMKEKDEIFNKNYNIHFEPIACVRSVIDKEKFFEENILSVDRKAIALEMESYGIVRACKLINNGNTIPLIIKSVMDNTYAKTDEGKKLAAWTSAKVLEYIISNDII